MSCIWSSGYNSWRLTSFPRQFYDTNEENFPLVSQAIWINTCHGEVKTSCDALHWVDSGKNTTNEFPSRFKGYADMNPHLLSEHDNHIILDKIEAREKFYHDEYVEYENYYNVDSYDSDDDDN